MRFRLPSRPVSSWGYQFHWRSVSFPSKHRSSYECQAATDKGAGIPEVRDRRRRSVNYQAGQRVWLKSAHLSLREYAKPLRSENVGFFTIEEMVDDNASRLQLPAWWLIHPVLHVSLMRPATEEPGHLTREQRVQQPLGENEYEVESITGHSLARVGNKVQREFLIQELDGVASWILEPDLANAKESIRSYFWRLHRNQKNSEATEESLRPHRGNRSRWHRQRNRPVETEFRHAAEVETPPNPPPECSQAHQARGERSRDSSAAARTGRTPPHIFG
ncbi:reverse transcriptase-rnase h-integrase [Cystoisospora suis]|uniref:Reverse transcriptase-rnase h-integrase n=1 Tax=Cystoisospora suis TaxID=483139 RepID=A0A2C6KKT2_9APIC|nr:reverse transcriptase-rnase h-integrase [Cystoisospora suis]